MLVRSLMRPPSCSRYIVWSVIHSDSMPTSRRCCFTNCSTPAASTSNSATVLSDFDGSAGTAVVGKYSRYKRSHWQKSKGGYVQ